MAVNKINSIEKLFIYLFCGVIDLACMAIAIIPGIDLLGWPLKMFGEISLDIYFLIKGGFGGRRSGQKIGTTLAGAMVGAAPGVDDFIPNLTFQSIYMFWILNKELKEKELKAAANDNKKQNLSRAA